MRRTLTAAAALAAGSVLLSGCGQSPEAQFIGAVERTAEQAAETAAQEAESAADARAALVAACVAAHDCSGVDLTGPEAAALDLSGVRLSRLPDDLTGVNLAGSDLTAADATFAQLSGVDFTDATTHGLNIDSADLSGVIGLTLASPADPDATVGIPATCPDGEPSPIADGMTIARGAEVPVAVLMDLPAALAREYGPCTTPTTAQIHEMGQQLLAKAQN